MTAATAAALAALVVAAAVAAGVGAHRAASQALAGPAPDWRGLRDLAATHGLEVDTVAGDLAALASVAAEGHAVALPEEGRALESREAGALLDFARRGGRVLVLGRADAAAALGFALAPEPVRALDGGEVAIVVNGTGAAGLPTRVARGAAVAYGPPGSRVLAWSSEATFLDADGDGQASPTDAAGPFALARSDAAGRVVVVGAPTLLGAEGLRAEGAPEAASDLLAATVPPGTLLLLDDTRAAPLADALARAPLAIAVRAAADPWLGGPLAALLAAAGALFAAAPRRPEAAA